MEDLLIWARGRESASASTRSEAASTNTLSPRARGGTPRASLFKAAVLKSSEASRKGRVTGPYHRLWAAVRSASDHRRRSGVRGSND